MPRPGQVLGLVGVNGIGKSTALKILAGKLKPNLGRFEAPPDWQVRGGGWRWLWGYSQWLICIIGCGGVGRCWSALNQRNRSSIERDMVFFKKKNQGCQSIEIRLIFF
jgi:energy-coupling factor transporter ATP-binding protein EcfA2